MKPLDDKKQPSMGEIVAFLLGEGSLNGLWYGDELPAKGRYWWRSILRETFVVPSRDALHCTCDLREGLHAPSCPGYARDAGTAVAPSHGAATDSVPLGTISECPSCGGDGKLTTTPGQFGPCWRCGGSGRVMAYREEKEQFDAKMQKIGAFVAACNGEQPSSTRQSDVLVGRTQTALRRFDDNVDMGDPESVAAWWNKHGAPLLDTIDKAASSPASAIGAWITVEQMKADGTIYAIDISPEPPCLIQWKDGAWRFMGGMRCATVLEGVKRALQVMAPTDGSGHHG